MARLSTMIKSVLVALFLSVFAPVILAPVMATAADISFEKAPLTVVTTDGKQHVFTAELALDADQREQGLMYRREMAQDQGMLFDFGETRRVMMWMKNTYLPLDMLFLSKDGTVKTIREKAEPLSEAIIDSRVAVSYVLELNAGTVARLNITPGAKIQTARIRYSTK